MDIQGIGKWQIRYGILIDPIWTMSENWWHGWDSGTEFPDLGPDVSPPGVKKWIFRQKTVKIHKAEPSKIGDFAKIGQIHKKMTKMVVSRIIWPWTKESGPQNVGRTPPHTPTNTSGLFGRGPNNWRKSWKSVNFRPKS